MILANSLCKRVMVAFLAFLFINFKPREHQLLADELD